MHPALATGGSMRLRDDGSRGWEAVACAAGQAASCLLRRRWGRPLCMPLAAFAALAVAVCLPLPTAKL
eukprot:922029-Prorocentrum_lima.AAC.1